MHYEVTILTEVLSYQTHELNGTLPHMEECLLEPRPASGRVLDALILEFPTAREFAMAKEAWFSPTQRCMVGDIVLVDMGEGELNAQNLCSSCAFMIHAPLSSRFGSDDR